MRHCILILMILSFSSLIFGQSELDINYDTIKAKIEKPESDSYYPKLLKRFNEFDSTLTLQDYSLIYYKFSFTKIISARYIQNSTSRRGAPSRPRRLHPCRGLGSGKCGRRVRIRSRDFPAPVIYT